jgi:NAD-dependent deacetylase
MTLASPAGFAADPALVWEWYRERRAGIRASQPNAAHVAVTRLALEVPEFLLVTQNVDDLHRRATHNGRTLPEDRIAQIHGDIFIDRCEGCDQWGRESLKEDTSVGVPRCDACGARMRPGVVWFGEILDPALLARVESFVSNAGCTVIVVGTTAQFGYIVDWSVRASRGGRLIEINPERTPLSDLATEVIRAPATASLPALVERLLTP